MKQKFLLTIGLFMLITITAYAQQIFRQGVYYIDNIYYELDNTTLTAKVTHPEASEFDSEVMGGHYQGDIVIPSTINYQNKSYIVTKIGGLAFLNCSKLNSVVIPNTVTDVAGDWNNKGVFYGSAITKVDIPNSIKSIGYYTFSNCRKLKDVVFHGAFNTPVSGSFGFSYCTSLESIDLPEGVQRANFIGCSNLENVTLPNSMTYIECRNCTSLESITIPNSLEEIDLSAFSGCTSLKEVNLPLDGIKWIHSHAFYNCPIESPIILSKDLVQIDTYAFVGCLSNDIYCFAVDVPLTLTQNYVGPIFTHGLIPTVHAHRISLNRYKEADYWKNYTIVALEPGDPGYDASLDIIEFACPNTKAICVQNWDTNGDGELSKEEAAAVTDIGLAFYQKTNITSFDEFQYFTGVTSIGDGAMSGCSNLKSITFPASLTSIGRGALSSCSSLKEIVIPKAVEEIDFNPFNGCSSLEKISVEEGNEVFSSPNGCNAIIKYGWDVVSGCKNTIIPEDVEFISDGAFQRITGLTSIQIPASVHQIGTWAFAYCTGLTSVTMKGATPPTCKDNNAFIYANTSTQATLYVPGGSKAAYVSAGWGAWFKDIVEQGTGISTVQSSQPAVDNYYTLDGRKVQGQPAKKGVYIVNGRKVVIK